MRTFVYIALAVLLLFGISARSSFALMGPSMFDEIPPGQQMQSGFDRDTSSDLDHGMDSTQDMDKSVNPYNDSGSYDGSSSSDALGIFDDTAP